MNIQKLTPQILFTNKLHYLAFDCLYSLLGERLGTKTYASNCLSGGVGWERELRTFRSWQEKQSKDLCSET